jgi:hypothetical protein
MPESAPPSGPSADLVRSLLSLSNSIEHLGVSRHQSRQISLVQTSLRQFINEVTGDGWARSSIQSLYDLAFLWKLADLQGAEWADICHLLDDRIEANVGRSLSLYDIYADTMLASTWGKL